jgi:hypothetical protein
MYISSRTRRILLLGLAAPILFVVLRNRSLWLDEAALGYSIVTRSYTQLLQPLSYSQVAPVGYVLFSKICNSLFGYNDIAIRLPSLIAYLCLFVILARGSKRPPAGLLRFVLVAGAAGVIKYAFELKPYIYDVLLMMLLLNYGEVLLSSNRRALLFSTASVLFSNVSFIQLPLFALLDGLKHRRSHAKALLRIMIVSLPLAIYYFVFAYRHPAAGSMSRVWSKDFLFSGQENALVFVVHRLIDVVETGYFTVAFQLLWIFYFIALRRYIRTRNYFALAATHLPVASHLAFSALRLYPFDGGRLTLYLLVPFAYCAADGLRIASISLARWQISTRRREIGSLLKAATILAVAGNAFAYGLLAPKREDIRPIFAELKSQPPWYKRSVPLHFLPSSDKQFAYYAAQSHVAGKPFLEDYREVSYDYGWEPFLRDVLSNRRVLLVFSHSGRYYEGRKGPRGYLAVLNRRLVALDPSMQEGIRVSRFIWANGAGLFEVKHSVRAK